MGSRGPAPKPTALKKLAGNPGKRSINLNNEPQPRAKRPRMPAHFTPTDDALPEDDRQHINEFYEIARGEWRRVVRELGAVPGLLASVDADALAMYAETYARWVVASRKLAMGGMVIEMATQNGGKYMATSPYMAIVNQCLKIMKQLLTEFGMTPASRTRIQIERPPEEDPFDEFLGRR